MRNRSFFWPFFLIAAGLVWLLIELHVIPVENLWALAYIWPFLLMAAGVALIFRSRWPGIRMAVSGLVVLGMILCVIYAPQFGWNRATTWGNYRLGNLGNIHGVVRGSGVYQSETRQVSGFHSVVINYPVELTIQQGVNTSITVKAEDNLLPQIASRITGNTLFIENSQSDWTKRVYSTLPVKINLVVNDLQKVDFPSAGTLSLIKYQTDHLEINISGAGSTYLSDLSCHKLIIGVSGTGNITASGTTDELEIDISGLGDFQGMDMASQNADITISGAGSATVWTRTSLRANISGTGSVNYYGSPKIEKQISGLGSVNSRGNK